MIDEDEATGETAEIRVTGSVQGVGFRPFAWRLANEERLVGEVRNDGEGVLIRAAGSPAAIARLVARLAREAPPLAQIDDIRVRSLGRPLAFDGRFQIVASEAGLARTGIAVDAAICSACEAELLDPRERRFGYPFINCTNCGPRFSIITKVPYDRANTTMANFRMCEACRAEYEQPEDRRFHAEPIACAECGPRVWLEALDSGVRVERGERAIEGAAVALADGRIVAIRGLGGFHLACDATDADAIGRLRARKRRDGKPLAIMVGDAASVRRHCRLSALEQAVFEGFEAPIVVLRADGPERLPASLAPGLGTLGVMRPYTPLHRLLIDRVGRPLVMTSGNLADEPQITSNGLARARLAGIADFALLHDREIAMRIDDSLVRVMAGHPRMLRRARGYAPAAIPLPPGFADAPSVLAFGGEQKATFCLLSAGAALLSAHQGDLDHPEAFADYRRNIALHQAMIDHQPQRLAADLHPEYRSTKLAFELADERGLHVDEVQHHHAHIASCLAEHGVARTAPPVLGVALDGTGFGDDATIWGGEFLLADYRGYRRLGSLMPVALPGAAAAVLEPWRSLYAHVVAAIGWSSFVERFGGLQVQRWLASKPLAVIDRMLATGIAVPKASSCGRLFDAVAAALGCGADRMQYAAQGPMELESLAQRAAIDDTGYPFATVDDGPAGLHRLDPAPMWSALFEDLCAGIPTTTIAARFHRGLAQGITQMLDTLAQTSPFTTVVLSGGCMQNQFLLELLTEQVEVRGLVCLSPQRIPANDGGIALGQALVAAARD